jgi:phosphohistidine phosphatase
MLTLALLRHSKAVKDDPAGDHARRLSDDGREDAAAVGRWLHKVLPRPVVVLSSDARRTRDTTELAFPDILPDVTSRFETDLYGASAADLLDRIRRLGSEPVVVLVGHNPGIGDAVKRLAGSGDDALIARVQDGYPTSSAAILTFEGTWADIQAGSGRLADLYLRARSA